jgi:molybdopterin/thiamine biosynthesis adenylyltransferase
MNPHVSVVPHEVRIGADNARGLLGGYELVIDGTDNFDTRRVVAEACEVLGLPLVSGAVSMWDGQVTMFLPGGRRFADLYPVTPDAADVPSCEAVGVLGAVTGVIGTLMAMEAIKWITGAGDVLAGRLMLYDGRAARFTELEY